MTAFAIVTPIVGISTYITVFNLGRIAAFFTNLQASSLKRRSSRQQRRVPPQDRPSSAWYIPQFHIRKLFLKAWIIILSLIELLPGRRRKEGGSDEEFKPTPFGDLRDVHVKIEVDVNTSSAG